MSSLRAQEIDFEAAWTDLEQLLSNILTEKHQHVTVDVWQEAFFDIYKICVAMPEPLAGPLFNRVKLLLETHVRNLCLVSRLLNVLL